MTNIASVPLKYNAKASLLCSEHKQSRPQEESSEIVQDFLTTTMEMMFVSGMVRKRS
jgi:hypothetical protein